MHSSRAWCSLVERDAVRATRSVHVRNAMHPYLRAVRNPICIPSTQEKLSVENGCSPLFEEQGAHCCFDPAHMVHVTFLPRDMTSQSLLLWQKMDYKNDLGWKSSWDPGKFWRHDQSSKGPFIHGTQRTYTGPHILHIHTGTKYMSAPKRRLQLKEHGVAAVSF